MQRTPPKRQEQVTYQNSVTSQKTINFLLGHWHPKLQYIFQKSSKTRVMRRQKKKKLAYLQMKLAGGALEMHFYAAHEIMQSPQK